MTTGLDNSILPGVVSETYDPDQLIAGRYPLVTGQGSILTGGALLQRGSVLGQITIGAPGAAVAAGAGGGGSNTGNGVISAISVGAKTKVGTYTIRMTGATTFNVINPNGVELKPGTAAGAYTDPELNFTFTAGGTPMIAGDGFTIAVAAGSGKYTLSVATATDGSQVPNAILTDITDATGGDVGCGVYIAGEFNQSALTFDGSWTLAALTAAMQPFNIYLRVVNPNAAPS